jgi:hypothetical protein
MAAVILAEIMAVWNREISRPLDLPAAFSSSESRPWTSQRKPR